MVDQAAAVVILQNALDTERASGTAPGEIIEGDGLTMTRHGGASSGTQTPTPAGGRRAERSRRRGPGCLIALVILAVLAGAAYWGVTTGIDKIKDQFSSAEDYPGPGSGEVNFEVKQGDSIAEMGRGLKAAGVVASVDAFIDAAGANPEAGSIQAGFYPLKKEMKASDVVAILVDPDNIVTTNVTIPEGLRVKRRRRPAGREDRLPEGRVREGARRTPRRSGSRRTPRATRRATCSRRPTTSAPRRSRPTCSTTWWCAGSRRPPTTTWRPAPRRSATRRRRS